MPERAVTRDLAESEARYRALFEHARDAMLLADDEARYVDVNPAACALLGYSRDELLGLTVWDVTPPALIGEGRTLWETFIAGGHLAGEYSMVRKDGTLVPVEFNAVAHVRPGLHLTITRQVSERLEQAERLRASEERYRNLLAHAPLVLHAVDASGRFTLCEGRGLEAAGLTPDDVVGRSAPDLYGTSGIVEPSGRTTSWREMIERTRRGEAVTGTMELDGTVFESTFLPIRNASGAIDGMMGISYDVTELHHTSEALREDWERFRRVLDNISDIITVLDTHGTILYESPSIQGVLGYEPEELVGRNAFDLVHPDDLPHVRSAFDPDRSEIGIRRYRFRHRNGGWLALEAVGKAYEAEDGVRMAVISSRDLTERERGDAESQLLQNVTWRVAEASDADAALETVMRLACETFGWVLAEAWVMSDDKTSLTLSHVRHCTDPELDRFHRDRQGRRLPLGAGLPGRAWAGRTPVWMADVADDDRLPDRDRAQALGLHTALALPLSADDGATVDGVLVLYSMQTRKDDPRLVALFSAVAAQLGASMQRKRAERALRSSQTLLRSVVMSAPIVVFALDRDGVFTLSEGAGLKALALEPGELVGVSAFEVYEDVPELLACLRRVLAGETFVAAVTVGGRSYDTWYSPRFDAQGSIVGALGVATDVTERRHLEDQLRQAQKLESVGLLAGGIAHDFNNLLTAITGYAELILEQLPPGDPMRDDAGEISRAAEKAALLTYQLLAFSRKQILRPSTVSLNDVVRELSRMLRRIISEDIAIVLRLADDLGLVNADAGQLSQVIMNLVVNARDAMPKGGTLTIETANVDPDDEYGHTPEAVRRGPYVMLAVSDTGIGMSPEVRQRVFEPFFTTKDVGKGTGMGLPTVYGIVEQSGGHVRVSSEVGCGSTFTVCLPRAMDGGVAREPAADAPAAAQGRETVLLVEDEEVVRRLARRALESCGYTVLEAGDGVQAMALYERHAASVDLLITDVVMPTMSGRDLVERLIGKEPRLKVLYMSGYTDTAIVQQGVLEEGTHFIQKPFTMRALAQKVRGVLDVHGE